MKKRLLYGLVIFLALMWLPWYVAAPLLLAGFFLYSPYYEGLIFVFLYDALYAPAGSDAVLWWTVIGVLVFAISYFVKPKLRDHA